MCLFKKKKKIPITCSFLEIVKQFYGEPQLRSVYTRTTVYFQNSDTHFSHGVLRKINVFTDCLDTINPPRAVIFPMFIFVTELKGMIPLGFAT